MSADAALLEVTTALADPLRMAILQHLMDGPATVSELLTSTGASQSNVSNHLAILRKGSLVRSARQGRQQVYELRDASVGQLVESLGVVAGARQRPAHAPTKSPAIVAARTCYDHLAGRVGVALFDALVARGALVADSESVAAVNGRAGSTRPVTLGHAAPEVFGALGIDVAAARREKRKLATACLDWTERRPHLGGALGAALWSVAVERGWVVRQPGSRAVLVTEVGRAALADAFALSLEDSNA